MRRRWRTFGARVGSSLSTGADTARAAARRGPYDIPAIAEEIAWTSRELGLRKPVLVVHSMGVIGFELVRQCPDGVAALVVLDAPLLPPPVRRAFEQFLEGLASPAYREAIAALCEQLIFLPTDDRERRATSEGQLLATPQELLLETWRQLLSYDPRPAIEHCRVPLLYLHAVMPFDEAELRRLCSQLMLGRSVGAGHFHQLEVPEQINPMIERFLALVAPVHGS